MYSSLLKYKGIMKMVLGLYDYLLVEMANVSHPEALRIGNLPRVDDVT